MGKALRARLLGSCNFLCRVLGVHGAYGAGLGLRLLGVGLVV